MRSLKTENYKTSGKTLTLFAIPFAGGSKYSFNLFKDLFPAEVDFVPIELPGRGERINEKLKTDIFELTDDIYRQIKRFLHKPYALFGHSMGSTLVYLVAQKITKKKDPLPRHIFVSGRGGPSCTTEKNRYLLPKLEFTRTVIELGGLPDEVISNQALMDFFEPILRADFQVLETYKYKSSSPMNIPITVLIGKQDEATIWDGMQWQKETTIPISLYQFDGGHFFIYENCKRIVKLINIGLSSNPIIQNKIDTD